MKNTDICVNILLNSSSEMGLPWPLLLALEESK
jgi:hypothetical protein